MSEQSCPLTTRLDDPKPATRRGALKTLCADSATPRPFPSANVNMHMHSFFSYNAEGWSPTHVAWGARQAGLWAAGLCDFDVLDGLDEFYEAAAATGMRAAVHIETRAYVTALAADDINSPGEPGVAYVMGGGLGRVPPAAAAAGRQLAELRDAARRRNEELVARINARLPDLAIDYARDVLPLTPADVATERHIISAYRLAIARAYPDAGARTARLADLLGKPAADCANLEAQVPAYEESLRARLAKRGGVGYVAPTAQTFPPVEPFFAWVRACGAIPMIAWLDGDSAGERDAVRLVRLMCEAGALALNIIPDRNWNYKDPAVRARKTAALRAIVEVARARDLPINVGTEMNRLGLPFVDDLSGAELAPYAVDFQRGAAIMVGQSTLARYADYTYVGAGADEFPAPRKRNAFFEAVGRLPALDSATATRLTEIGPQRALVWLRQQILNG